MIILQLYKLFSLSIHLGLWYQHFLFYHATYLDIRLMSSYKMMWLMNLSNPCFRYWLLTYSLIVSVYYSTEYNRAHIQYIPLSYDWHKLFNAHGYRVQICFRAKSIFSLLWKWYGKLYGYVWDPSGISQIRTLNLIVCLWVSAHICEFELAYHCNCVVPGAPFTNMD